MAMDELMRELEHDGDLYYFPSYEIVTAFLQDPIRDDPRHPKRDAVAFVMQTFKKYFRRQRSPRESPTSSLDSRST